MSNLIEEYLEYLKLKKLSNNTIMAYERDLKKFKSYLDVNNLDIKKISINELQDHLDKMAKEESKPATISRQAASLRSLYKYLFKQSLVKEDPTENLKLPKIEKEAPHILTTKEIELFLSQPDEKSLKGVRDKAMLEFAYATGMKVSEITNLSVKDINLKDEYVICNEGYRRRVIPLGKISVDAVRTYLEESRPFLIKNEDEETLFVNLNGRQLTRQGFWKIIKQYKEQANIEREVTPHVLRHSFATHLLQNGADLNAIQNMMGHADISSTQVYLQFMDDDISQEYKNAHPRA